MYTLCSRTFVTVLMEILQMLWFRDVKHDLRLADTLHVELTSKIDEGIDNFYIVFYL